MKKYERRNFLFAGYIGYMLVFVKHLPCSCGGVLQGLSWGQHLLFNLLFLLLAVMGTLLESKPKKKFFDEKVLKILLQQDTETMQADVSKGLYSPGIFIL